MGSVGDERGGVRLVGWDIPAGSAPAGDAPLRVIAAVECVDPARAPSLVALVVRDVVPESGGQVRVATVRKYLPSDGTPVAVGLEAPLSEAGEHELHVMVVAVGESGELEDVLFETTQAFALAGAAPPRGPMPRLQQSEEDSLVLCGVDVPATVEAGRLRAIVALKRTWHDAPTKLALIVRDLLPDGSRRAAVARKTFGDDADTIGLEVPMAEAGVHTLTLQVAKVVDGEFVEVFREERVVHVTNPPPPVLAENHGLVLCGVDTPASVQGSMRAIVALQRTTGDAPSDLCLIARNTLPDGTKRAAVVRKVVAGTEAQTIGIEVPMGEAGEHWVEFSVAECTEEGNIEIFFIPARPVQVTNPPPPRIQQADAVVLCGIDVCGARWPDLRAEPVSSGTGRVIVAVARTWEDAPTEFILTLHDVSHGRSASVRKSIKSCVPETIGLEVPMKAAGVMTLLVRVAAQYADGSVRTLFEIPAVDVQVHAVATPPAVVLAENHGLVLCGVDTPASVQGSMRAIVALQRTTGDAPSDLCLIARNTLPDGTKRAAVVRKVVAGTEAQTIGIEVPMGEAGEHWVEFSVAECTEEGLVEIFFIPARRMCVALPEACKQAAEAEESFSEPELVEQEEEEEAELVAVPAVSEETVSLKVGFFAGAAAEASVIRRLSVVLGVDAKGRHVEPLKTVMEVLTRAFKNELQYGAPPFVRYTDEVGEEVHLCSDQDMCAALRAPAKGGVVRLSLHQ